MRMYMYYYIYQMHLTDKKCIVHFGQGRIGDYRTNAYMPLLHYTSLHSVRHVSV